MSCSFSSVLLANSEMAEADRLTIAGGTAGSVLMENAGAAVAKEAAALLPCHGRVAVFCGPGNNGGDGFVAARLLAAEEFTVNVGLLGDAERLRGDAANAAESWTAKILAVEELSLEAADLVIDALFGAGLSRDLDGPARALVVALNNWTQRTKRPILAVDIPSGIDGTSGQIRGAAIKAARTITFFRRKPGHLLLPGRLHCGETSVAQIGIPDAVLATIAPNTFTNSPAVWRQQFPVPRVDGHKYSRGHAVVLSGGLANTGAARLAARGALRAGAGLVTVAAPQEALAVHASALTAIMTRVCDGPGELISLLADRRKNALVIGPGLGAGECTRALVRTALNAGRDNAAQHRAIVLDADALSSFEGNLFGLAELIRHSRKNVVLTPHDGEFARLFGGAGRSGEARWAQILPAGQDLVSLFDRLHSASKLDRARASAAICGAITILKGPDTVVASPRGMATIAEDLPPWLATAGSGDVLAGIVGGLLAQSMPPFEAASAAVWLHGAAARHFGPGLIAEDIPENLPPVLRDLYSDELLQGGDG
ncbi:MAG: NAD(P)H-hydrate epimerase [Beijerinckiaceae bacterium]|nr:NAD(P)H-hydrate epimerase [Beijerinckiaceae bacterium]MCI0736512.1 NAD(P)H-hydrate epimerase [Beijerinckiaceae bacterium]